MSIFHTPIRNYTIAFPYMGESNRRIANRYGPKVVPLPKSNGYISTDG